MKSLNQRAAEAMGWDYYAPELDSKFREILLRSYKGNIEEIIKSGWIGADYEHDRNALALLLEEVGRRSGGAELARRVELASGNELSITTYRTGDYDIDYESVFRIFLTAPASVLCEAAVLVLEQGKDEPDD